MTKLEQFISIFLGFWIFEIVFIRLAFFVGVPISALTLPLAFITYSMVLIFGYAFLAAQHHNSVNVLIPIFWFLGVILSLLMVAIALGYTYDTSWDGQGYHQSAVIALANNWNPVLHPQIPFVQRLPSQIFAEGYPSALWEIEASIYTFVGRINSAKVVNIGIAVVAGCVVYSLLRKIKASPLYAVLVTYIVILQPVYLIQLLTFMEDGFGYQLLVIAVSSLVIIALFPKSYWAMLVFVMSQLLLVTTKYNLLPAALMLNLVFVPLVLNRLLNKTYQLNSSVVAVVITFLCVCGVFAYLPYIRNQISYSAMFYPTNIPELMGSVKYNNVPNNLHDSNKFSLLFYGIFSRAQSKESGDPRSETNIATLKVPFTFTMTELNASVELYNNRVGGGGPIYGGLVVASFVLLAIVYFQMDSVLERYTIYASFLCVFMLLGLALVAPTPNLMRYVNQLQLLPFVIVVPIYIVFKQSYIRRYCLALTAMCAINVLVFYGAVVNKNIQETLDINKQFTQMRNSGFEYNVKTQQFYSSYIILQEQNINFVGVEHLGCDNPSTLYASSTTVQYCPVQSM